MICPWTWRFVPLLGLLSLAVSLQTGCDRSHEREALGQSRLRLVIETATTGRMRQSQTMRADPEPRQILDPLDITSLQIEVVGPNLSSPVVAMVSEGIGPQVAVDLIVPQGPDRQITVEVLNGFTAVIYRGATVVDLFLPVHDVALMLAPEPSVNPVLEAQVTAALGGILTVNSAPAGLMDLTLNVPPAAFTSDTLLTVGTRNHPALLPPLPAGVAPMGPVLGFESGGASLLAPLLLTLPYDPIQLAALGAMETALSFYSFANGAAIWTEVNPVSVDPNTAMLTAPLSAFGSGVIGVNTTL